MKNFLSVALLAALALSGCVKGDNGNYKELQNVLPGVNIQYSASTQNWVAFQPANAGMRLAVLMAEANKQGEEDLSKVLYKSTNVQGLLFGTAVTVEKQGTEGDYKIAYPANYENAGFKGALIVKTGNVLLSETSSGWTVETSSDFQVIMRSNDGSSAQYIPFSGGATKLLANGDGSYTVSVSGIRANVANATAYSDWSGSYRLRSEGVSLAYSDGVDKDFSVNGSAQGASIFSYSGTGSTEFSYTLSDGKYVPYSTSSRVMTGTEVCRLIGRGDYDPSQFPAAEVRFVWSFNGQSLMSAIYYNGFVYQQ